MRSAVRLVIVIALLAAAIGAGVYFFKGRGASGASAYRTLPAKRTDILWSISATGTVVPEDVVDVGAQVNGQVASFGVDKAGKSVDYRSEVDEGMVLAKIDDVIYAADVATSQAQLAQAQAQVRVDEANLDQARARLDQSQRDWARAQKLGQTMALSQADFDAAKSGFEQAQAAVAVAEASVGQGKAQVQIAQAAVDRAQRNLNYCTITSPVNGVIIDRRVDIGQTVVSSLNAPSLFLIAKDLSRMQVLVQVNEADVGRLTPGQKVTFTVDAYPEDRFNGEVRKVRLNATMTQNVVTYTVEIVTDNSSMKLLPYLTANVTFIIDQRRDVVAVPNAALRWSPDGAAPAAQPSGQRAGGGQGAGANAQGGGRGDRASGRSGAGSTGRSRSNGTPATVYTLDAAGKPVPVEIRAGLSDGSMTEVLSGDIEDGTQVVVGEQSAARPAAAPQETTNPFAPKFPGRGGGGGGRGGR